MEMFWASAIAHSQILQHPQLQKRCKKMKFCTTIKEILNQKSIYIIDFASIFGEHIQSEQSPTLWLLNK
jgi:hypothetical protein